MQAYGKLTPDVNRRLETGLITISNLRKIKETCLNFGNWNKLFVKKKKFKYTFLIKFIINQAMERPTLEDLVAFLSFPPRRKKLKNEKLTLFGFFDTRKSYEWMKYSHFEYADKVIYINEPKEYPKVNKKLTTRKPYSLNKRRRN